MGTRSMLAAAIAGACGVAVGAVLMTSAARSAATTVPVSVRPGMLVFNPANVKAQQGDTAKRSGLGLWDWNTRSAHATFSHTVVHAGRFGCHRQRHALRVRYGRVAGFGEDVEQQKPGAVGSTALVTRSTVQSRMVATVKTS
jgi:plastocyanin